MNGMKGLLRSRSIMPYIRSVRKYADNTMHDPLEHVTGLEKRELLAHLAGDCNPFRIMPIKRVKAVSTTYSKPVIRHLGRSYIKRHLTIAVLLAAISGFAFKRLVADERRRAYAEFYRTYDADKEFEIMKAKGLFQSC